MTRGAQVGAGVVAGLLGGALGSLWWLLDAPTVAALEPLHLVLFLLATIVTELVPMQQPGGRPVATSIAIIATLALLGASPVVLAGVAGVGWLVARLITRDGVSWQAMGIRIATAWAMAGAVSLGAMADLSWTGTQVPQGTVASLDLGAGLAVAVAIVMGVPTLQALAQPTGRLGHLPRRITEAVVRSWMVGAAIASTALLGGLVHEVLGAWTLPTMLIPLLAARFGLERLAVAAQAYDQTIRAMSRLPEQLGAVDAEHGVRVGRLADAVGVDLGLDADMLMDLEYAAHLHELGRVRHDDPEAHLGPAELGAAGASIIRETASLSRVAAIVEAHGEPHLARGEIAVPARIVAACCAADRYGPVPGDEGQRQEVLVRLVRDIGDLDVVAAVSRVLEREQLPVP